MDTSCSGKNEVALTFSDYLQSDIMFTQICSSGIISTTKQVIRDKFFIVKGQGLCTQQKD